MSACAPLLTLGLTDRLPSGQCCSSSRIKECINHWQVRMKKSEWKRRGMHRILGTAARAQCTSDSFIRLYLNDYHYAPNAASRLGRFLGHSSEWPTKWTSTERHYLYRLLVVVLFLLFLLIHLVAASQHPTSNRKGVGRLSSSILHTRHPLSSDAKEASRHSFSSSQRSANELIVNGQCESANL